MITFTSNAPKQRNALVLTLRYIFLVQWTLNLTAESESDVFLIMEWIL